MYVSNAFVRQFGWRAVGAAIVPIFICASLSIAAEDNFLIPAPKRSDMVYHEKIQVLFIASGDSVLQYDLTEREFLSPLKLGGDLLAIDLSPLGTTLLVTDRQSAHEPPEPDLGKRRIWIHQIDMENKGTGASRKVYFPAVAGETNTHAVAFAADGTALVTSDGAASATLPLRRYDPETEKAAVVVDRIAPATIVNASGDTALIAYAEGGDKRGNWGYYRSRDKTVRAASTEKDGEATTSTFEIAVNGGGKRLPIQFALPTPSGLFVYDEHFKRLQVFSIPVGAEESPISAVYTPVEGPGPHQQLLYTAWSNTSYIGVWDTKTFQQVRRIPVDHKFRRVGNRAFIDGRLRIDPFWLFVTVEGGVRAIRLAGK